MHQQGQNVVNALWYQYILYLSSQELNRLQANPLDIISTCIPYITINNNYYKANYTQNIEGSSFIVLTTMQNIVRLKVTSGCLSIY